MCLLIRTLLVVRAGFLVNSGSDGPTNRTVLQQHVDFWDEDKDGIIYPMDTYRYTHSARVADKCTWRTISRFLYQLQAWLFWISGVSEELVLQSGCPSWQSLLCMALSATGHAQLGSLTHPLASTPTRSTGCVPIQRCLCIT